MFGVLSSRFSMVLMNCSMSVGLGQYIESGQAQLRQVTSLLGKQSTLQEQYLARDSELPTTLPTNRSVIF